MAPPPTQPPTAPHVLPVLAGVAELRMKKLL